MADNHFLIYCMGNSGGSWLESVLNSRPDILAIEEANRHFFPKVDHSSVHSYETMAQAAEAILKAFVELDKNPKYKSIGLIKSFSPEILDYVKSRGGKIFSLFRHPVKVLDKKYGTKVHTILKLYGVETFRSQEELFEAHANYYANRYLEYLNWHQNGQVQLIKLETLSASLSSDKSLIKILLEQISGVVWSQDQIENIALNYVPQGASHFSEDFSEFLIWESWPAWKREIFIRHFQKVLKLTGYQTDCPPEFKQAIQDRKAKQNKKTTSVVRIAESCILSNETNYQGFLFNIRSNVCIPLGHRTPPKWKTLEPYFASLVKGKTFLDIGCNFGFFNFKALECGATSTTGIEANEEYFQAVDRAIQQAGLRSFVLKKGRFPEIKEKHDVVMALSVVHHIYGKYSLAETVSEIASCVSHTLIIEWIDNNDISMNAKKHSENNDYNKTNFEKLLSSYFPKIKSLGHGHHLSRFIYLAAR